MTDTIDQRADLVEAITAEVLAALGMGAPPASTADPCASCLRSCAAQCATKVREIVAGGASRVEYHGPAAEVPSGPGPLHRPHAAAAGRVGCGDRQALRRGRRVSLRLGLREPDLGAPLRAAPARQRRRRRVSVVGFPFGATPSDVKAFEARRAIRDGAREIDMVINIGALKSGSYDLVREDIARCLGRLPRGRASGTRSSSRPPC